VGTSVLQGTRSASVWFTVNRGSLSEVYFPRVDRACLRGLDFVVVDGRGFVSSEPDDAEHRIEVPFEGVPYYRTVSTCKQGRYRIEKEFFTHPERDVVIQVIRFKPLIGELKDYHLYALAAPHLANRGGGNSAWLGEQWGVPMLFADRSRHTLAIGCSAPWIKGSAGFVGASDGWTDIREHGELTWEYGRAEDGNVLLTGEIDLNRDEGAFTLDLGFGHNPAEAALGTLAALYDDVSRIREDYIAGWKEWQKTIDRQDEHGPASQGRDLFWISMAVIRTHENRGTSGAIIASLSSPWGNALGDEAKESGGTQGYHLVWPRDLCESAAGLLAAGADQVAKRVLVFLRATQTSDGHWPQNMWVDGASARPGIQIAETGFPIILLDLARREEAVPDGEIGRFWPMVRRAVRYIVENGPSSKQDRWENEHGYTPFTLGVVISALLVAADQADEQGEGKLGTYLRETADAWNHAIERWLYVTGTETAKRVGVPGYYARIIPPEMVERTDTDASHHLLHSTRGRTQASPVDIVSPDALALVRFGLRAPDDPRILDTVKVIDTILKVETPGGPCWLRYNGDSYGEQEDGTPFTSTSRGIGRAWPLLTGERGHYELAAGRPAEALRMLQAMAAFAGDGGMISEQIWDAADIPEKRLFKGRATGSAQPLVWAHSEYVKLRRSIHDGRIYDQPPQTVERYLEQRTTSNLAIWKFEHQTASIEAGEVLRVEVLTPATIRWSAGDDNSTWNDVDTRDVGLGIHLVDLPTRSLQSGEKVRFTFHWQDADRWEGRNFAVAVVDHTTGR
jgi:glucoamylase